MPRELSPKQRRFESRNHRLPNRRFPCCFSSLLILVLAPSPSAAGITKIVIEKREPFAKGHEFGITGGYEKLAGKAYGEVDPKAKHNKNIVNLAKAPKNERGRVEYLDGCFYFEAARHGARQPDDLLRCRQPRQSRLARQLWRRAQQRSDNARPRRRWIHDAPRLQPDMERLAGRYASQRRPIDGELSRGKKPRRQSDQALDFHRVCFSKNDFLSAAEL